VEGCGKRDAGVPLRGVLAAGGRTNASGYLSVVQGEMQKRVPPLPRFIRSVGLTKFLHSDREGKGWPASLKLHHRSTQAKTGLEGHPPIYPI
jgi:hypothetical protein